MEDNNLFRLWELDQKIEQNAASDKEKEEFMFILYLNGSITKQQYENYIHGKSTDDIFKAALTIGAIVLFGFVISKILKS